jgi:hypothetical protein
VAQRPVTTQLSHAEKDTLIAALTERLAAAQQRIAAQDARIAAREARLNNSHGEKDALSTEHAHQRKR